MARKKLTAEQEVMKAQLTRAYEETRAKAQVERSPANMEAARQASAQLSAWITENDPPKRSTVWNRAGRRQAAERRALAQRRTR